MKWDKKICLEHITELKSPLEGKAFSPTQKLREMGNRLREMGKGLRKP